MASEFGRVAMRKDDPEGGSVAIKVSLPPIDSFPPPIAANYFTVSRVGGLVQLTVGFVDLHAAAVQATGLRTDPASVDEPLRVLVTHRIVLDPTILVDLKGKIDQIVALMRTTVPCLRRNPSHD